MNLPAFIARRYFLSKKKKNFINVISIISMLVVGIATMALVIVLSVFNGLEGLLRSLYGTFDPQIEIRAAEGKSFIYEPSLKEKIYGIENISSIAETIEDNALIKYKNAQRVVRLKGVSQDFLDQKRLDKSLVYGSLDLEKGEINYALVGRGIQYDLQINPSNDFYTIQVWYPRDIRPGITNPEKIATIRHILPGGIFAIEKYYDDNYIIVPLSFATELMSYGNRRNTLEIQVKKIEKIAETKSELKALLGEGFTVKTNDEIHEDLYKVLKIEKFFVFFTFSVIIAIASINIYFALTMLAIDKEKDISILKAMGANSSLISKIFICQGAIVAFTGAFSGLALGLLVSLLQQKFGLISMGMETAIMEAYPIKVETMDVVFTCLCIVLITFLASFQPARLAAKKFLVRDL